jgi:very-short-patch-repair endonuclease
MTQDGPSPASLALGTLSPEGRGDPTESAAGVPSPLWGEGGAQRRVRGRKVTEAGVSKARVLRRTQTEAEQRLWNLLRNRSVAGLKFVRQFPIEPFVVDFVCRDLMLVIEVDGRQHLDDDEYDARRTRYLNARGYSVLRFWNNEVLQQLDGVYRLVTAIARSESLDPSPGWRYSPATLSPEGRGDLTDRT